MPFAIGEGELLDGCRARLADVVARDGDRVEERQPLRAVREEVGRDPHRGPRRKDVVPAGDVLLEDVVLDGAAELVARHALLLGRQLVEQEQQRGGRVDRHRRRDAVERDAVEDDAHVGDRVDRYARAADLAPRHRVVGVVAELRRQVERDREPGLPELEQIAEALVRLFRRAEAGVLADRPRPAAVHRRSRGRACRGTRRAARCRGQVRRPACRPARSRSRSRSHADRRPSPCAQIVRYRAAHRQRAPARLRLIKELGVKATDGENLGSSLAKAITTLEAGELRERRGCVGFSAVASAAPAPFALGLAVSLVVTDAAVVVHRERSDRRAVRASTNSRSMRRDRPMRTDREPACSSRRQRRPGRRPCVPHPRCTARGRAFQPGRRRTCWPSSTGSSLRRSRRWTSKPHEGSSNRSDDANDVENSHRDFARAPDGGTSAYLADVREPARAAATELRPRAERSSTGGTESMNGLGEFFVEIRADEETGRHRHVTPARRRMAARALRRTPRSSALEVGEGQTRVRLHDVPEQPGQPDEPFGRWGRQPDRLRHVRARSASSRAGSKVDRDRSAYCRRGAGDGEAVRGTT